MDPAGALTIGGSVVILGGLGLVFAALIALTHRKFKVWEDPRIDAVAGLLPGSNCGACGQAGCRAFAEGLVTGAVKPAECTVVGADGQSEIADYLGVDVGQAIPRVARLLCAGGDDVAPNRADYTGISTCTAAAAVAGGGKACTWGCLGFGDCAVVCTFDAIVMNPQRLPIVVPPRCTACGDCVDVCPKDLFVIMPLAHRLIVQCKSALEGDEAEQVCRVACTACGKCAVDGAPGLIEMRNGLAVVDYAKNDVAGPEATQRCPTGAIVWVEGAQFAARPRPVEGVAA
jgi:Na+-translocating ferredoxin:NAD+ oxidoreductase subunit B